MAELVCSNSLKSESEHTAPWLLKEEMRRAGSLLLEIARETAVPAGHALAVDRELFAAKVTSAISGEPHIHVHREEVTWVDEHDGITIIATGPLTSDALSREIARLSGSQHLYFYDSISPIVEAESIDMERVYLAARYDKGTADYINCPFTPRGVRPLLRCAAGGRIGRGARLGEAELLRGLPAHRGAGAARTRHPALRADEAGWPARSPLPENSRMPWFNCAARTCAPTPTTSSDFRTT